MKRRNARIIALITLYNLDINKSFESELIDNEIEDIIDEIMTINNDSDFPVEIDNHFVKQLVKGTVLERNVIDEIIQDSLSNYTIDRLSYVDRALIRIACFEMRNNITPKQIVINEFLEITKEYSEIEDNLQVKFNNRVLENIAGIVYGK